MLSKLCRRKDSYVQQPAYNFSTHITENSVSLSEVSFVKGSLNSPPPRPAVFVIQQLSWQQDTIFLLGLILLIQYLPIASQAGFLQTETVSFEVDFSQSRISSVPL